MSRLLYIAVFAAVSSPIIRLASSVLPALSGWCCRLSLRYAVVTSRELGLREDEDTVALFLRVLHVVLACRLVDFAAATATPTAPAADPAR